ncbi:hypothetical protein BH23ACT9_BH23ACT9_21510 [soil metagenome]
MGQIEPPVHPFAPQPTRPGPGTRHPLAGLALRPLQSRFGTVPVLGLYALVNGLLSIAIMTAAAMVTGVPLIFPSLGPTAYLLFSDPLGRAACPRNALIGHGVGVLAGYGSLAVFGLTETAAAMDIEPGRVGAAALSLALTSAFMVWLGAPHAPGAATTLIVSLGIIHQPLELLVLMGAVVLLVSQGFIINRLAGVPYPLWAPYEPPAPLPPGYAAPSAG